MLNLNEDSIFSGFELSRREGGDYGIEDFFQFEHLRDILGYLRRQRGFISAEIIWRKDLPEEFYPQELRDEIPSNSMDILILIRRKGFQPGKVYATFLKLSEARLDRTTGLPTTDCKKWMRPCGRRHYIG